MGLALVLSDSVSLSEGERPADEFGSRAAIENCSEQYGH